MAANAVGVWLAAALVWPALGNVLEPFTYGRWMPLHLDWQLYGWSALPLVGVLLAGFVRPGRHGHTHAHFAIGVWSLALLAGGVDWLAGRVSGRLFLDWTGRARLLLPLAMCVLWTVLAAHLWWRRRELGRAALAGQVGLLALLVCVPPVLYLAAGRHTFPAINPASGGATGTSLLGSTLGIVTIYGLVPDLLRLPRRAGGLDRRWWVGALAASWLWFALVRHGNVSSHRPAQIIALGSLLVWVPLLRAHIRSYDWAPAAERWLRAAFAWWLALVVTGWLMFLPALAVRLKFTDALVGHAHLAMAGFVTSANLALLRQLRPKPPRREAAAFWWWQGACVLYVAVMLTAGWFEGGDWQDLFLAAPWTRWVDILRLAAGVVMAGVSVYWWKEAWRETQG